MLDRIVCGEVPDQPHTALRGPDGALRYEQCLTRRGFSGPYTISYHVHRPHEQRAIDVDHGWSAARPAQPERLLRRHYRSFALPQQTGPPLNARRPLLVSSDVVISVVRPSADDPVYFSNGDGDDLYFVLQGAGLLRSALGDLRYEPHDYVCVPKGVVHRFIPDADGDQFWLSLECFGGLGLLEQWRNEVGQLTMDAPYGHRDFRRPEFSGPRDEGLRELVVKRGGGFHGFAVERSPLDVVGYDGSVYPWTFPIRRFRPRVGQVHLPPTWHGTFATRGALICSFVPRPLDFHPEAIPCPYPHASVDVDEVLFYASGDFTSRRGIQPGSISHHPAGVPHGPHPGAYENSLGGCWTDELAVMLDCYEPLQPTPLAEQVEDPGYHDSFIDGSD